MTRKKCPQILLQGTEPDILKKQILPVESWRTNASGMKAHNPCLGTISWKQMPQEQKSLEQKSREQKSQVQKFREQKSQEHMPQYQNSQEHMQFDWCRDSN